MINGEVTPVADRIAPAYGEFDLAEAAREIFEQTTLRGMAEVAITHALDYVADRVDQAHAAETATMDDYLSGFEAMNLGFSSLSADDNESNFSADGGEGSRYNADQLSALMANSRTMTTLSADDEMASTSRHAAAAARQAERDHFVHNVLLKKEETKKSKKSDLSLAA